ncbi:MAG: HlyD family type I secretion periplasmic adaptor subunit [Sulfuritalea sp.]|nr:HlyD family type I secretion periplasmic adaptor subunit [Sulfuritalea sp.]
MNPQATEGSDLISREIATLRRLAAGVILGLVAIVTIWTLASSISGAVIASGFLRIERRIHPVQHPEGGIVKAIRVVEGETVVAGQILAELDDVDASATDKELQAQIDSETAKQARLEAEYKGRGNIAYPAELLARKADLRIEALLASEESVFRTRQLLLAEQRRKLAEQRDALNHEIASWGRQMEATERSLALLAKQEKMASTLLEKKFFAETHVLDARRAIAEKEEKKYEAQSLQSQARQRIGDIELRLQTLNANNRAEIAKEMSDSRIRMTVLRERARPASSALERRLVRAPVNGTVNLLKAGNPGSVIPPRETVVEIVPVEASLLAEVRIAPADISELHPGQAVDVEFSGLNRRATPIVSGKLLSVSADLLTDPANPEIRYFNAKIDITGVKLDVPLTAGMPVVAYIRTRERTPLELWLDPVIGALRHSLRER